MNLEFTSLTNQLKLFNQDYCTYQEQSHKVKYSQLEDFFRTIRESRQTFQVTDKEWKKFDKAAGDFLNSLDHSGYNLPILHTIALIQKVAVRKLNYIQDRHKIIFLDGPKDNWSFISYKNASETIRRASETGLGSKQGKVVLEGISLEAFRAISSLINQGTAKITDANYEEIINTALSYELPILKRPAFLEYRLNSKLEYRVNSEIEEKIIAQAFLHIATTPFASFYADDILRFYFTTNPYKKSDDLLVKFLELVLTNPNTVSLSKQYDNILEKKQAVDLFKRLQGKDLDNNAILFLQWYERKHNIKIKWAKSDDISRSINSAVLETVGL